MALSIHDIITTIAEFGTTRTCFSMLSVNKAWRQAISQCSKVWIPRILSPIPLRLPPHVNVMALVLSQLKVKCRDCLAAMNKHNLEHGAVWHVAAGDYEKRGKCELHWDPTFKDMQKRHTVKKRPRTEVKLIAEHALAEHKAKKRERDICESVERPTVQAFITHLLAPLAKDLDAIVNHWKNWVLDDAQIRAIVSVGVHLRILSRKNMEALVKKCYHPRFSGPSSLSAPWPTSYTPASRQYEFKIEERFGVDYMSPNRRDILSVMHDDADNMMVKKAQRMFRTKRRRI